jgi:hypothetical protein
MVKCVYIHIFLSLCISYHAGNIIEPAIETLLSTKEKVRGTSLHKRNMLNRKLQGDVPQRAGISKHD